MVWTNVREIGVDLETSNNLLHFGTDPDVNTGSVLPLFQH